MKDNKAREAYLRWRSGFVLKLCVFHFMLVLVFDILAVYTPHIMLTSVAAESAITIGLLFAFMIVISVICSTFYYSHRLNQQEEKLTKTKG